MKKLLPVLLLLAVFLAACGEPQPPQPQNESLPVPPASNTTQPIDARVGSEFFIILDANPSTGYEWDLVEDLDTNLMQFVSKEYDAGEPVAPGSGGVDVWTFRAVAPGETRITLGYYSPSSSREEPEQTATFIVTVK